jgi:all-trans-retinol 13,14-reductase
MAESMSGAGERRFDVVVIGSGIGGLTAALTAAALGRRVLVLEAGKQLGGYSNPFRRGPYAFDPGLHYIGECGPGDAFMRVLQALDLDGQVRFRELSPRGFDRLVFPGYEVTMPRGAELYQARLEADFPHEREGLSAFFDLYRTFHRIAELRNKAVTGPPFEPERAAVEVPGAFALAPYLRATFRDLLEAHFKDPQLLAVLGAQGGNYGLPPGRASAIIGLGVLDHYLGGAYFPVGGSGALRDAFVDAITRRGGTLLRSRSVTKILLKNGRASGVLCADGEAYFAGAIISNADATRTYRELIGIENLPESLRKKTEQTRQSLSSVCLFVGTTLDVAAAGMTDANIWHFSSTDLDAMYEPLFRGELSGEDFFFLSAPSLKDPESAQARAAPEGIHHRIELVALAPYELFAGWDGLRSMKRGNDYDALKERLASRYLQAMERYVPSIREHIDVLEVSTPVTNVAYAAACRGALYGPDHAPDQYGQRRFSAKGALPGLFLCGASVLGGGIVPSALSGFMAAKLACKPGKTSGL